MKFTLLPLAVLAGIASVVLAQGPPQGPPPGQRGQGGPGGPGGPNMEPDIKVVAKFDANKDGWLNQSERAKAREDVLASRTQVGGRQGGGFGRGGRGNATPPSPGKTLSPNAVAIGGDKPLYDRATLRTVFLEFENADWEKELEDFHGTDVEVPATLTLDRKVYKNVGVSFRGASSYMMVPAGNKRSFNLSVDMADSKQRVMGYKTLNLLNSNGDPTFFRTVLYSQIAEMYLPVPKVNLMRVAVNGESWGVYVNTQQFNKEFLAEHHKDPNGVRWKAPGRPNGNSGLNYLGDDPAAYQRLYEIKTDNAKEAEPAWKAFIQLCKTLEQTPVAGLEKALAPMLDLHSVVNFLALENALVNSDGYWTRASDYSLFLDTKGKFHIVPHDINEAMATGGGRGGPGGPGGPGGFGGPPPPIGGVQGGPPQGGPGGGRGGPGGGGPTLDPFVAINAPNKPLISKLLTVPSLRAKYLATLESIAKNQLQWSWIEPIAKAHHALVGAEIEADTRKNSSYEAYVAGLGLNGGGLRQFVEQRGTFLLAHPEIRGGR